MKASTKFKMIAVSLSIFAFGPIASALNPAPDGGYFGANTAEGESALWLLTTGTSNTAVGYNALFPNTEGSLNTAVGFRALTSNVTGTRNTAIGAGALFFDGIGGDSHENTAIGVEALYNINGSRNTATGRLLSTLGRALPTRPTVMTLSITTRATATRLQATQRSSTTPQTTIRPLEGSRSPSTREEALTIAPSALPR